MDPPLRKYLSLSIRNHHWKAQTVSYHASPLVVAPGALLANIIIDSAFYGTMVYQKVPNLIKNKPFHLLCQM